MKKLRQIFFIISVLIICCNTNISAVSAQNNNKPNIRIIATGGTIAGTGTSSTSSEYKAGTVMIDNIINAIPGLENIANVTGEQLVNIGSQDMTEEVWIKLAKRINELMDDPNVDGIVITHGTDTMDETAYFLSQTTKSNKPVIITGAMRPSTHISADGPANLYDAVSVAANKNSKDYGVLVVMNDKIYDAADVTKMHTRDVNAFDSPNKGAVGFINSDYIQFYNSGNSAEISNSIEIANSANNLNDSNNTNNQIINTKTPPINIDTIDSLPKVGIIYGYAGIDTTAIEGLVKAGYKGIVYAGVGNGNIHKNVIDYLSNLTKKGIIVMRSSRVPAGGVLPNGEVDDKKYGFIPSYMLSPQKGRIKLMLMLCK